jgi:SAM-dependent methyltransferase
LSVAPQERERATASVRAYWNSRIHDLEMTTQPIGSARFFQELDEYRFDKLAYLPRVIDFNGYRGKTLAEVGCGIGTDLVRFARGGAIVTGIDLSETAVRLARTNLIVSGQQGSVMVADGGDLPLPSESVDVFYAHGVLQYAPAPRRIVDEALRVLRPGGQAIFMVYNRVSWLMAMSRLTGVSLEHQDAPVLDLYSESEFRHLIAGFRRVTIVPERFPVKSRLHHGWKAAIFNGLFVSAFNAVPRPLVRRFGWHLMAICEK